MSGAIEVSGVEHVEAHIIDASADSVIESVKARMADHLSPEQNRLLNEALMASFGRSAEERMETLVDRFVAAKAIAGRTERTCRYYRAECLRFAQWCPVPVASVSPDMIRSYLMHLKASGCSDVTLNNVRRVLSSFFGWCENEGHVFRNVMRKVDSVKVPKTRKKPFSDIEVALMRECLETRRDKALFNTLLSSGVRVSEACGLDIADVDIHDATADVLGKGRKERRVYLSTEACHQIELYIEERDDDNPALFVAHHRPHRRMTYHGIEVWARKLGERAGVANCHPHRFRRTMATNALRRGMPIEQVQRLLGHEKVDTTLIYAMTDDDDVAYSARRMIQ
jgi:site-specific recombinase XerD